MFEFALNEVFRMWFDQQGGSAWGIKALRLECVGGVPSKGTSRNIFYLSLFLIGAFGLLRFSLLQLVRRRLLLFSLLSISGR